MLQSWLLETNDKDMGYSQLKELAQEWARWCRSMANEKLSIRQHTTAAATLTISAKILHSSTTALIIIQPILI